jgi:hypothetical protein
MQYIVDDSKQLGADQMRGVYIVTVDSIKGRVSSVVHVQLFWTCILAQQACVLCSRAKQMLQGRGAA